jgi:hypothetical protein
MLQKFWLKGNTHRAGHARQAGMLLLLTVTLRIMNPEFVCAFVLSAGNGFPLQTWYSYSLLSCGNSQAACCWHSSFVHIYVKLLVI